MRHEEGNFKAHDGLDLYRQCWSPDDAPKANLAVVHGYGEHSGRYQNFAEWFVPRGYAVYSFDQRGHGKSPGQRGHINAWSEFREDLRCFMDDVRQRSPSLPTFLIGHSMGGLVVLDYALHHGKSLPGVVASGPLLARSAAVSPMLFFAAQVLNVIMPRLKMDSGMDSDGLARDKAVVDAYRADPLVHGFASPRFAVEVERTYKNTLLHATDWPADLPLLIVHGGADTLSLPAASARFFENVSARDKKRNEYPSYFHEVFNEIGREKVLSDIGVWLDDRLVRFLA